MEQSGFFDVEERLSRLIGLGGRLGAFSRTVDFEVFRPNLNRILAHPDGSKGGRPPFGLVTVLCRCTEHFMLASGEARNHGSDTHRRISP